MKSKMYIILFAIFIVILYMEGCTSSAPTPTPISLDNIQTNAVQTYVAQVTAYANQVNDVVKKTKMSNETQKSTSTPAPSVTFAPTITNYPTTTLIPFVTITPWEITNGVQTPKGVNPTSPSSGKYCNWAEYVDDITAPDGTRLLPKSGFTKTWRLKNIGGCTWTPDYFAVFVNRDLMEGPTHVPLTKNVKPGDKIDISVDFTAPARPGEYTGNWMLMDGDGVRFGTGADALGVFWVRIIVINP